MDCAPSENPDLNQAGSARRAGFGSVRACGCRGGLHGWLFRLCGSSVAVRPGPRRVRIPRHRYFQPLAQRVFQLVANVLVFLEEYPRILAPLAHALAPEADPRPALFQHALFDAQVDQVAFARNSFAVHDVEFGLAERRRHFVLHHFRARARAHHFVAFLDRLNAPDIHAHRRIKLQRPPARCGFGIPKHHADLFANLVDENQASPRLRNDPGQLAQRLRHQPCLQTHLRIAHFPFQLRLRHQRGNRVYHHDVHATRTDQRFRNLQRLLPVVRLRHQEIVHIHAEFPRVNRIQRMLRINERRLPAELLRFGDHVQRHGRLAARFRPVNLNHASPRESAHAQRRVNRKASAGNYTDWHQNIAAPQPHDRTLAVVLFDLRYRRCEQFCFLFCHFTPRWRKVGICICTTESRGSAPGKRGTRFVPVRSRFERRRPGHYEMWSLPLDSFSRYPFLQRSALILISALQSSQNAFPSFRAQRGISLRFVEGRNCRQLEHHYVYRWHQCSASWSWSRVCAACSRPSNAAHSNGVRFLSRVRFLPRLRASVSSSSSLARSRQLRTPFESPRTKHLLKTTNSKLPPRRTKSKHYFSPYVRLNSPSRRDRIPS